MVLTAIPGHEFSVGHSLATQMGIMLFRWKSGALHGHVPVNYSSVALRARPVVCAPAPAFASAYWLKSRCRLVKEIPLGQKYVSV